MGELGALFNPGMRHELEERQAKASRREEEGNGRDGDLRIDLESGVAVIGVVGVDGEEKAAAAAAVADETPAGQAAAKHAFSPNETPSAERSAADDGDATGAGRKPATPPVKPRGKRGLSHSAR
ncbi:MAG: DUF6191 domain-containing protein [Nakamurella sp.]